MSSASGETAAPFSERTAWVRNLETPLRDFLRTETGSAVFLLAATIAALAWVNIDASSYDALWRTTLSIHLGGASLAQDLRQWVNTGLLAVVLVTRAIRLRRGLSYAALGAAMWVALFKSGVDPVVVGLVLGLLTYAYPATRSDLESASERFRLFREQPTPQLARSARA